MRADLLKLYQGMENFVQELYPTLEIGVSKPLWYMALLPKPAGYKAIHAVTGASVDIAMWDTAANIMLTMFTYTCHCLTLLN